MSRGLHPNPQIFSWAARANISRALARGKFGDMISGNQMGQRIYPALCIQGQDPGICTIPLHLLLNQHVTVSQCGNLGGMCNAEDLMSFGALAQYPGRFCLQALPEDATVYFVVNDGRNGIAVGQCIFDGQRNTAQLTAGSNFGKRLGRLTWVGGDVELDTVLPMAGQRPAAVSKAQPDPRHIQKVQCSRNPSVQILKCFEAGLGQNLSGLSGQPI